MAQVYLEVIQFWLALKDLTERVVVSLFYPGYEVRMSIRLDEMIADLRDQLEAAVKRAPSSGLQFILGEVELELQVQISQAESSQGTTKFNFNVLPWFGTEAEAQLTAERQKTRTHIFKIRLKPRIKAGDVISDPLVSRMDEIQGDDPPFVPGA